MTEMFVVLGLYVLGAALVAVGALLLFGLGVCLIVVGGFVLAGALAASRGIARVPAG